MDSYPIFPEVLFQNIQTIYMYIKQQYNSHLTIRYDPLICFGRCGVISRISFGRCRSSNIHYQFREVWSEFQSQF